MRDKQRRAGGSGGADNRKAGARDNRRRSRSELLALARARALASRGTEDPGEAYAEVYGRDNVDELAGEEPKADSSGGPGLRPQPRTLSEKLVRMIERFGLDDEQDSW